MSDMKTLREVFKKTTYQIAGHSKRDLHQLQQVLFRVDGNVEGDMYGTGELIGNFESKMAEYLGKESAVFFPSGTMAQQIALRIWCDEKGIKKVAYHPLCHLEIHEEDGLKELHQIEAVLLADKDRVIELDDVLGMDDDIACLLLELPQREIGGQLPSYEDLEAISQYCREKGIRLHLDGARLLEILPYYQKSADEVCALFDSVYVSFYKGIGGIAGAILAGDEDFTKQSKVWKRRHGGDLISLYPYIVTSEYHFEQRKHKFNQYYEHAKELARLYNQCQGISTRPAVPVSNMFHVHADLPQEELERIMVSLSEETGIGFTHYVRQKDESSSSYEVSIGDRYAMIPKEELALAFEKLNQKIGEQKSKAE
ncbi:threonine aldolase family protein [Brevibacillus porteri]|uniref:Low specificity L-threonine aldolase n=1 Tax=Brevibacillus porteri TaxID=2126350 RepID=A0ABX5FRG2_9BACL|nr:beta-eliminating lyase-related protein [Brevibacillus porteri]MED1797157.1 beta-eliminating lyase-related protein [Brevibacillus porteri]MED2133353.1 beta-eliminating lyase-related protein [Brevibacillus porteri]MED2746388.1 beta-eliminating lyase-related protein [Brevibacillus porteri]MED2815103.1 beta-eliminating lyase-related protein [Brevibacillus porteri]MED2892700.1 beta-eliminating lyase-related protein [Brevibacillus porteri]